MPNNLRITQMDADRIRDKETYVVMDAAITVHRESRCGFLEAVYQDAFEREFQYLKIPHKREVRLPVYYRGEQLNSNYQTDFICFDSVIVELKTLQSLSANGEVQVINHLKSSNLHRTLQLDFGSKSLQHKRMVFDLRIENHESTRTPI